MKRLDCSVVVKVKVTVKVQNSVTVHLDGISSTAEPFVTKLDNSDASSWASVLQEDSFAVFKFRISESSYNRV